VLGRLFQGLRPWCVTLILAVVELASSRAVAEEEAFRILYQAPASCPDQAVFVERMRARTEHGKIAAPGELARTFDVSVSEGPRSTGFLGHVEFVATDGQRALRTVAGTTCDEVVSSLALITALAIDDRVAETESVLHPPLPRPRPVAPTEPPQKSRPSRAASSNAPELASLPVRAPLHWDLGGNAGVSSWVAPGSAVALGGFVELGSREPSWSVRLSGFDARESKSNSVGQGRFATDWLRLEACPVAAALSEKISLSPCAALDGGVLHATGAGAIVGATNKSRFWGSGVLLVRLAWVLGARFFFGLDGELAKPFVTYDYKFETSQHVDAPLFTVPAFGVGAKLGVGVRFP
jgi:hypothetical protein